MILEAFSDHLKRRNPPSENGALGTACQQTTPTPSIMVRPSSRTILEQWLQSYLSNQVPLGNVAAYQLCRSIQTEFTLIGWQGKQWIAATSTSGQRLWATLQHYADSYDQWQFARWVHHAQASDFSQHY